MESANRRGDSVNPTAQDVVDAIRFLFMAQKDVEQRVALVDMLVEMAPETADDRGIKLILDLLAEGSLKAEVVA